MRPHASIARVAITLVATLAVCSLAAARPDTRAPLHRTLDSLFYAGRYDTMRTILPALMRQAEMRGDSAGLGRLTFQRGRVEITLGHQAVASDLLDRSLRLCEAARDTTFLLRALNFKGFILRDQGHFDDAMALFERERTLGQLAHDPSGEGNAIFNLANKEMKRGNLEAAKAGDFRAMELFRKTGDPYQIAIGTNALGNIYRSLGKADSSRIYLHETLRIGRENRYPFHELWALNNVGVLERDLGNYETAVECFRQALAIGRRIGFDRGIALASMNLTGSLAYLGRGDEAFELFDECQRVCQRAGFRDLEETTLDAAGELYQEYGRYREAAASFRTLLGREFVFWNEKRSWAASGLAMTLADMDSVPQALDVLAPYVSPRAQTTNQVAQAYWEMNYIELLRFAGRYQEALDRVTVLRAELDRTGRTDMGVEARLMESDCRLRLGDAPHAAEALASALDSLEIARTDVGQADYREAYGVHIMSNVIDGCRVALAYPHDAPWNDRVHKFYDALQRFKTRALLDRIKDPRGKEALAGVRTQPITASTLQGTVLRQDELLLDMVVGAERSYMFAVTTDSCRVVTLPGWRSALREQAYLYADLLSQSKNDAADERITTAQRTLGDAVLGPVSDLVTKAKRVLVAPDGFYAAIPFGTLTPGSKEMLLQSREIIEVPSASVLAWSRQSTLAPRKASSIIAVEGGSGDGLAGAHREVNALRKRYANVDLVTAQAGVLDTLAAHAQPNRILHIAAHARVSDQSPWQSGFVLDPGTTEHSVVPRGETVLRAWEIARAHLPYDMAVLAGCETAAGWRTSGEGVLGLTSAFLSAGVPVVVSSRWAVDDKVTADLMGFFY
ncbi:MAG TPA: CHAT domain-containing tetratricopeptide repeat protein, partial [Candidatus Krumholzibacteria bacterium]|nr:CHAT domain-containing tetratricopeptide repeat protein [Candidatus Krumholzibacteria bacterium]